MSSTALYNKIYDIKTAVTNLVQDIGHRAKSIIRPKADAFGEAKKSRIELAICKNKTTWTMTALGVAIIVLSVIAILALLSVGPFGVIGMTGVIGTFAAAIGLAAVMIAMLVRQVRKECKGPTLVKDSCYLFEVSDSEDEVSDSEDETSQFQIYNFREYSLSNCSIQS